MGLILSRLSAACVVKSVLFTRLSKRVTSDQRVDLKHGLRHHQWQCVVVNQSAEPQQVRSTQFEPEYEQLDVIRKSQAAKATHRCLISELFQRNRFEQNAFSSIIDSALRELQTNSVTCRVFSRVQSVRVGSMEYYRTLIAKLHRGMLSRRGAIVDSGTWTIKGCLFSLLSSSVWPALVFVDVKWDDGVGFFWKAFLAVWRQREVQLPTCKQITRTPCLFCKVKSTVVFSLLCVNWPCWSLFDFASNSNQGNQHSDPIELEEKESFLQEK